jgi:hypothetical protein
LIYFTHDGTTLVSKVQHGLGAEPKGLRFEMEAHTEVAAQALAYILQDRLDSLVIKAKEEGYTRGFRERGMRKDARQGPDLNRFLSSGQW